MDKTQFDYQHLCKGQAPGGDEYYSVPWKGYTGGDIPAGLIVARLARLDDTKVASPLWTVFHKSGYVVNLHVALHTRKQAVSFAVELGKIADAAGFSWDQDRDTIIKQTVADGTYYSIKAHKVPEAVRKAMTK